MKKKKEKKRKKERKKEKRRHLILHSSPPPLPSSFFLLPFAFFLVPYTVYSSGPSSCLRCAANKPWLAACTLRTWPPEPRPSSSKPRSASLAPSPAPGWRSSHQALPLSSSRRAPRPRYGEEKRGEDGEGAMMNIAKRIAGCVFLVLLFLHSFSLMLPVLSFLLLLLCALCSIRRRWRPCRRRTCVARRPSWPFHMRALTSAAPAARTAPAAAAASAATSAAKLATLPASAACASGLFSREGGEGGGGGEKKKKKMKRGRTR